MSLQIDIFSLLYSNQKYMKSSNSEYDYTLNFYCVFSS